MTDTPEPTPRGHYPRLYEPEQREPTPEELDAMNAKWDKGAEDFTNKNRPPKSAEVRERLGIGRSPKEAINEDNIIRNNTRPSPLRVHQPEE